ncbi:hypothetical protein [Bacillus sp. EB600]|uniref:hypothetical protein n=1 Tax=Bacillus sp. EB600 TaxID=2806345 RepID=UPI00210DCE1F|nr:hypothetical protein [Bacillus sp. EB600]MCQ6282398.1 hypothetical protein [Bacillus sp. EB600]
MNANITDEGLELLINHSLKENGYSLMQLVSDNINQLKLEDIMDAAREYGVSM